MERLIQSQAAHRPFAARHIGKTRKANATAKFAKEPFSPSRSNAGQRPSAAKIDRLNNEQKNGQLVTSGHKTLGAKWLFEPLFSHQRSLYPDSEVAPKPPTILYRPPLAIIQGETLQKINIR